MNIFFALKGSKLFIIICKENIRQTAFACIMTFGKPFESKVHISDQFLSFDINKFIYNELIPSPDFVILHYTAILWG